MQANKAVSPRVRAAVQRAEEQSEILLSLIQVGFVLFMGTLYFIAPKGHQGDVPIRPVPLVLLLYSPFVVARLWLALRRRLTPALLAGSVVVDIAMICALVWTFHRQYQQPAGFYLKSPTAMYLFIFIALRALRYDPRYVLFAGITASLGWIALTFYAVWTGSGVTRGFVEYMTGTLVLIGAQVDRVIALITLALVLALAVRRSAELLVRAAREQHARQDLSRYFSPTVAQRITQADGGIRPGQGDMRHGTVLMIDLRGFSALAAGMEPAGVMRLLAEFQSRVVPLVLAAGGSIDKFMGDGILAHFGAAAESPTHAADALRAAETVRSDLLEWTAGLRLPGRSVLHFGMGIASGKLMFGVVGDDTRLEFTVIGTPVNSAAKLEKLTKKADAHLACEAAAYRLARSQGFQPRSTFRVARAVAVDGLREPLDVVFIVRDDATPRDSAAAEPGAQSF